MSNKNPVVVYGASGYTGRLIVEFLREYEIPFIAAGRNEEAIKAAMQVVPGIETADYKVVQVEHTVEALTELFSGAKVVCNTVGPYARFGEEVVHAALEADCHYLDCNGEQTWMLDMRDRYHQSYVDKGLLLGFCTAYMHVTLDIAARICLDQGGIDTLEAACMPVGVPTVGSTRTVMDMLRQKQRWLAKNTLVELEKPMLMSADVPVPGMHETVLTLPWGGGPMPLWYENDSRVKNCRVRTGFADRPLMQGVVDLADHYEKNIKPLPEEQQIEALNALADNVTPGMPPRENRQVHRTVDMVYGVGNNKQVKCTIVGVGPYLQTGLIQAYMASRLLAGKPNAVGFAAPLAAVDYRDVYAALQSYGLVNMKLETIG